MSAPEFTVVVACFNEAESLPGVLTELEAALISLGKPFELLVIDDGSADGSAELAEKAKARVIRHEANLGLGEVYRTGFKEARGRFVSFFPADGQFPASILPRFAAEIEGVDAVLGVLPAGARPPLGRFFSAAERLCYTVLFGGLPEFQGVLMFRRELLDRFPLKSRGRGWVVLMELLLRAQRAGCRFKSVPTELRPRAHGESKVTGLSAAWANLMGLLLLRLRF